MGYEVATGLRVDRTRCVRATGCDLRYRLLEPGGVQRRVELDPFKVVGRFAIVEQKRKAASEGFKALESERTPETGCTILI